MQMLTAEDVAGYLDVSPHQAARSALIVEIRDAVDTAREDSGNPDIPYAATFSLEELAERGISGKRGSGLKASRNDRGPIHRVATLDGGSVLVVLNESWTTKDADDDADPILLADFGAEDADE